PPTTTRCFGTCLRSRSVLLVRNGTPAMPGICGTEARPPTLIKIRGAVSVASPTETVSGPTNRACAVKTVQCSVPRSQASTSPRDLAEIAAAPAWTPAMSTRTGPSKAKPYSSPRRMRGLGAGDQRLGRHAAGIDAGAAESFALDDRDR